MAPRVEKRKLVTVRKVAKVTRISDDYDLVAVDGWNIMAAGYEGFVEGEPVVYVEIDSFIPASDDRIQEYEEDFTTFNGKLGYHVRSQVKGGVLSQGIIFHLDAVPEVRDVCGRLRQVHGEALGSQMAEQNSFDNELGIVKWEPSADLVGRVLGAPPTCFPLPGCMRVQNDRRCFKAEFQGVEFQVTEKLDGYSLIIYYVGRDSPYYATLHALPAQLRGETMHGRVGVCGQKYEWAPGDRGLSWTTALASGVPDKLPQLGGGRSVAVMGELVGHSVLGNDLGLPEGQHHLYVFDIFDIDDQCYWTPTRTQSACRGLQIPHVPVIGYYKMGSYATSVPELLDAAEGRGFCGQNREGIVLKSMPDREICIKAISNSWLKAHGL